MIKRLRKASFEPFESISANSRYVRITRSMMQSAAWKLLNAQARLLYIYLKGKYSGKAGTERDISFTYDEAKELLNMDPRAFTKARDSLIETGLLDLVEHWPNSSKPNIYGLSARWHKYGTPEFIQQTRPKISRRRTV